MNIKKQIIVICLLFGLITLLLIYILIRPLFKEIIKNSIEIINVKQELVLFQNKTGEIEELKAMYEKIEPDLEKIEQLFVNPEVPVDLIEFLEKTGQDSNLSIKISPVSEGFRLTLIGSFSNFLRFLEKIEVGSYLVEIKDLSIRTGKGQEEFYEGIKSMLTINIYVR